MTKMDFKQEWNDIVDILLENSELIQAGTPMLQMTGEPENRKWNLFIPFYKGPKLYVDGNLSVESKNLDYTFTTLKKKIIKRLDELKVKGVTEVSCECCEHGKKAKWSKKDVYWEGCPYSGHSHDKIKFCVFFEAKKKKKRGKS